MKQSKSIKAKAPQKRTNAKRSPADLKARAHMPAVAGDPIPRTKAKPSKT